MNMERLKQSSLVPSNEPRIEQVWELPLEIVEAIYELIAELNAEGYPITIDHVMNEAFLEWFEVDRTKEYEEMQRKANQDLN